MKLQFNERQCLITWFIWNTYQNDHYTDLGKKTKYKNT